MGIKFLIAIVVLGLLIGGSYYVWDSHLNPCSSKVIKQNMIFPTGLFGSEPARELTDSEVVEIQLERGCS